MVFTPKIHNAEGERHIMKVRLSRLLAVTVMLAISALLVLSGTVALVKGDQAPVASFSYSPSVAMPDETIVFNASASYDLDGWITQYTWNFGDGNITTVTSPTITYSYPIDGTYTVELTVTDNSGLKGVSSAVVEVSTVVFFRVVDKASSSPLPDVEVTAYYNNGSAWVKAPVGPQGFEIKYDRQTEPDLANTPGEKYRNPGYTASILRHDASNIGFDLHPSIWTVFFKFQWGSNVAYWPNNEIRVYTYHDGVVQAHDYCSYHKAYYDPSAGTYVIKVNNIPKDGVSPTESNPIIVSVLCPPPQSKHYLTVRTDPAGVTAVPGEGWYNENTSVVLTAPEFVDVSPGTRYAFAYWDVDGASRGTGVNPITVFMDNNHTATAHYVTQYSVIFNQTGLSPDASGAVVTVNGSSKTYGDLPYIYWVNGGSSVTYSYSSTVTSSVTGKRFRLGSTSGPSSPITVTGPVTVTGNYVTQYLVTFAQTGLDSTATGTVVTVNGSAKAYGGLPYSFWADSGSWVTYSYNSIVTSSVSGKQFRLVAVQCPPPDFSVTSPTTITGVYCTQYLVTFAQSGLDPTATGTVVTVNGSAKALTNLPYTIWVDSGSSVTYSFNSPVSSTVSGKRFRLNSVSGPASPITVSGPTTVTGNYVIQYLFTFAQSGLDSSATGTVVTVNGSPKVYSNLPYTNWFDSGSSVTYSYSSTVAGNTSGKQFRLSGVSGPASPITVAGVTTVTGNYVAQCSVIIAQSGLDLSATGTVVIVNGSSKGYGDLPYTVWVDCGGSITYSFNSPVSSSTSGKRFRLNSVTGAVSPITVNAPATVTGNYVTQYAVTFAHTGLDSSAASTVVTVNGSSKTYGDLPFIFWVDNGLSVTYSYNTVVSSTVSGKRFQQVNVTGSASPVTVTGSSTVTGNYKVQYQVTFDQAGAGSDYTGTVVAVDSTNYGVSGLPVPLWWDQGSNHNFTFASPLVVNSTRQYSWSSTSGLSAQRNGTLVIGSSGSVVGNYMVGNTITFDQTGLSSDFAGTVVVVDGNSYGFGVLPVSFIWQVGTVHNYSFQSPLVVGPNTKQYVWNSTSGLSSSQSETITVATYGSIVGNYKTQYYLDLPSNPPGKATPSGSGWYYAGAYASISTDQYVPGGSRYRFANWTTDDMSGITDPNSPSTTVLVDKPKSVTANYVHQHLVTFAQTGLASDANGTVLTIDLHTALRYTDLPYGIWVDEGDTIRYNYWAVVTSTVSGKRYSLTSVTGPSSPLTVSGDISVTGNYGIQYFLTVSSPYGTPSGQGWYDSGGTAYASLAVGTVDHGNGTRRVFVNWTGDASGSNYAQSDPITMNGAKIAVANWKTQYGVSFDQLGLDSSASGTVVTVNAVPKTYGELPYALGWVDSGSVVTYTYGNVSSSTAGKRFILTGISGLPSPITVTGPVLVIGNYKTQYQITFNQSGANSDFTGTVVAVGGTDYTVGTLPASFWWDSGSAHLFSFASPLAVNVSRQYVWVSTSGLSTLQSGTLTVAGSGSVTGNYVAQIKYQITFTQTGVGTDFPGTVIIIDGVSYKVTDLPVSFWWDDGSSHSFAYQSPLVASPNAKQYVWVSTSGLSTSQSGSITVSTSGTVTGNYKTQYYLTLATNPPGVNSPSGAGWYDANTNATISALAFVDIVPGSSLYRFNGWATSDMTEIGDPTRSPTTVLMDKAKTVTANYVTQYSVTFNQSGVGSDFPGTVVDVDGRTYDVAHLPVSLWWDAASIHTFAYQSPLTIPANNKRYMWTSTSGLSTLPSGSITASASGNVIGSYKIQYLLTVVTAPAGLSPQPTRNPVGEAGITNAWWYDASTDVTLTAQSVTGYNFTNWDVDGTSKGSGVNPIIVNMNAPHTTLAHYASAIGPLLVFINPPSASIILGDSVPFTSVVGGGTGPYGYQWYVGGSAASGATSTSWVFTPTGTGTYYVYLKVTDANGTVAQSSTSTVRVTTTQVGGYSISLTKQTPMSHIEAYGALVALFGLVLSLRRRKRK